jgi:hypothetical protein
VSFGGSGVGGNFDVQIVVEVPVTRLVRVSIFFLL